MLVKLDEMKISNSSIKAFMEDSIWAIRNYSYLGNFAIVAHSKIVKALVPIDRFFFERIQKAVKKNILMFPSWMQPFSSLLMSKLCPFK